MVLRRKLDLFRAVGSIMILSMPAVFSVFAKNSLSNRGPVNRANSFWLRLYRNGICRHRAVPALREPVEAPDGAAAIPETTFGCTSASTVRLPRESMISRPMTLTILDIKVFLKSLVKCKLQTEAVHRWCTAVLLRLTRF